MPELERRKKNKIIKKMISSSKDKNTEDERPGPVWKVVKKNVTTMFLLLIRFTRKYD